MYRVNFDFASSSDTSVYNLFYMAGNLRIACHLVFYYYFNLKFKIIVAKEKVLEKCVLILRCGKTILRHTEDFKECVEKFIMDKKKDVATEVIRVFA